MGVGRAQEASKRCFGIVLPATMVCWMIYGFYSQPNSSAAPAMLGGAQRDGVVRGGACVFDIDRTLTARQGRAAACQGAEAVRGVRDHAYGGSEARRALRAQVPGHPRPTHSAVGLLKLSGLLKTYVTLNNGCTDTLALARRVQHMPRAWTPQSTVSTLPA